VDHIFFILLLIFSPFFAGQVQATGHWRTPVWSLVKLATAFTVAHSLTLALATYKVFFLPMGLVELLVIFSIIFMGMHNLLRFDIKREWLIVFAFGLFHGYGFSAGLRNLGLSREHLVLPLVSFNLGVELGQILIIGIVFGPLYILARRWDKTPVLIRYATMLITLIASLWLLEKFSK
ncbi:MAG: HupE/UreJ family protein, partial [Candidatus Omnitrophica bacterium]|nr:HupE/UreJ family protein [Candidatus Omnitrophota bacterium]